MGQIYILQQFDFDHSKELPDKVELEQPLPLGFVKRIKVFFPEGPSIGKIHEAKTSENAFEIYGTLGSYKFKRDGNELRLVN